MPVQTSEFLVRSWTIINFLLSLQKLVGYNVFQSLGAAQMNAWSPRVIFVNWVGGLRSNVSFELLKLWEYIFAFHASNSDI